MADHPNLEIMRRGYDAFANGDMATLKELLADDIVWHVPGHNMMSGDYEGRDAVFEFFGRLIQETGGTFSQEIHDMLANDIHGVVLAKQHAERNGKSLDANTVHVMHITDGKLTEFWNFAEDTQRFDEFWS